MVVTTKKDDFSSLCSDHQKGLWLSFLWLCFWLPETHDSDASGVQLFRWLCRVPWLCRLCFANFEQILSSWVSCAWLWSLVVSYWSFSIAVPHFACDSEKVCLRFLCKLGISPFTFWNVEWFFVPFFWGESVWEIQGIIIHPQSESLAYESRCGSCR